MKKLQAKKLKERLMGVKAYYVAGFAFAMSLLFGASLYLGPAVAFCAYFSWAIFLEDIESYTVGHFNLLGLLGGGVLMALAGMHFDISVLRALIFFLIGWGMFQLFEGDIGGGDVRLVTVLALFLNTVQILSAISLAAAAGMLIGSNLKMKRVPFGALLIATSWLVRWIVRF